MYRYPTSAITEQKIYEALGTNPRQAFLLFYDYYAPISMGMIKRMVADEEKAEEILKESILRVWSEIESISEGPGSLLTKMIKTTRETALAGQNNKTINPESKSDEQPNSVSDNSSGQKFGQINPIQKLFPKVNQQDLAILDSVYLQGPDFMATVHNFGTSREEIKAKLRQALKQIGSGS